MLTTQSKVWYIKITEETFGNFILSIYQELTDYNKSLFALFWRKRGAVFRKTVGRFFRRKHPEIFPQISIKNGCVYRPIVLY